jgi:CubicO group peptidase (beta-lactamase class C family)
MVGRLAAQAPLWEPGTAHGYHAVTFGWLAGELVRRVDPKGRSLGGFVADEIVAPLGTELWIGLPELEEPRVAPLIPTPPPDSPAVAEMMRQLVGPETLAGQALTLNGAFGLTGPLVWNTREVHAAEIPAANAITNARSLARTYAATIGEVDGVRLLDDATVALASATATPPNEPDRVLVIPTAFGMGFMTSGMFVPMLGEGSFGHPGAGGSLGFAYPGAGIGFGYVMNQMGSTLSGDVRALTLIEAVKESLAG